MRLLGRTWTPEEADRWDMHDLVACVLSVLVFLLGAVGGAYAVFGNPRGYWLLGMTLGLGLLLWAVIDRKLRAQSVAFAKHEDDHKSDVDERNRWEA